MRDLFEWVISIILSISILITIFYIVKILDKLFIESGIKW